MTVSADHTDLPAGFNGHCLRLGKSLSKLLTLSAPALLMAALLMAAAVLWPLAAAAQNNQRVVMILEQNDPPIEVQADEMRHDQQNGRVNFIGNVRLTRGQEIITGDRAIWHDPTNTAEISGNVTLTTADFQATADRAAVNMDLRLAKIYNGRAFFPDRHYYVEGQVLERQGPETLYVNQAVFTTCDGADPSWSISASDLLVNRNGVALASGVLLRNKYFPMFYLPYFMVPIQNDRQTGFLIPSFGNSSRDGFVAATPFFWELAEDYDLTILPYYRSERGMAITVEGRYNLNSGHGIGIVTYLKDKQNNYYNFRNPGGQSRNSRDLFWIRTQNTWTAGEWDINLDLDLVSDPLFLYAFRNDLDGFEYSQQLFSQYFGRTVNEVLDPTRLSTLFAQRFLKDQYFRGSLTYTDNLYRRDNIDTLQNLPKLQYNLVSRPLDLGMDGLQTLGPRLSLDVQYDYFSRKSNDLSDVSETGHRLYVSPQLFFNKNLGQWLSLKADAGLNLAAYAPTGLRPSELGPTSHSSFEDDLSGDFKVELSTSLSRIFRSIDPKGSDILHQVTPVVSMEIVEAPVQEKLPYWDMFDRRLNRRTLRYGIRNTLTSKRPTFDPNGEVVGHIYSQLLQMGVYSSYEFASNIQWAERDWARYYTTGYFEEGVGPVEFEIESHLVPGVSTRLLSSLDSRTGRFTSHEISLNLRDDRGDSLAIFYDYDSPTLKQGPDPDRTISQIRGYAGVRFYGGFSANFSTRYDFQRKSALETTASLKYSDQCYGIALLYANTDDDQRVGLVIDLLGLGSFGTPTTSLSSTEN